MMGKRKNDRICWGVIFGGEMEILKHGVTCNQCKESHGQLSLPHHKHTAFRKRISLTCGCFGKFHLCKVQRSHDFIGKPSPICWNTGAMGIFWSHEFTPKKGCFFLSFIGTE